MLFSSLVVSALLAVPALASQHGSLHNHRRHHARNISKRSFTGRLTFYATGLGACGGYNNDNDYIVALNSAQYGGGYPGPQCGKSITISYGGKTAEATIRDECPTCDYGGLDLSPALFEHFASKDLGVLQAEWWFNDGSGGGGGGQQQPTTTSEPPPPETTTSEPPPPETTTSTPPPPPETTTSTTSSEEPTTTSSSSSSESSSTTSTSETPTSTSTSSSSSSTESSTSASSTSTAALAGPTSDSPSVVMVQVVNKAVDIIAVAAALTA
ncbi:hypothetical protein V5O48_002053 [Marasmius crinis-equi]|uniref:RlpA-like double-psi beta-barrel-protein domain-containing protein-containing protein n=1 Tax=Marasmius crinis-equi TaxID=585013 RepID=A0ABR3FX46_9AGAR